MATDDFVCDLELLLRSRHAIILVETGELTRLETLLKQSADRLKMPYFLWTPSKGLRHDAELPTRRLREAGHKLPEPLTLLSPQQATLTPVAALTEVETQQRQGLYYFQGLSEQLTDPIIASKLYDAARQFARRDGAIILTGDASHIPNSLQALTTVLPLPIPAPNEYRQLVEHVYRDVSQRSPIELRLSRDDLEHLTRHLQGLTISEAEKILTRVMIEDGQLSPADIPRVIESKRRLLGRDGLLSYIPFEELDGKVAGLSVLKAWLAKRERIFKEPERARAFGLPFPKGILLLGVQGGGKSLCAKVIARSWGLPLLQLDPAVLYNKFVGETERNLRRATEIAERMSPVVLWIDEIEKAFATSQSDNGVSQRLLGSFLNWLQERKGDVFIMATANDVSQLPPELMRKGRFDELFFVDLPSEAVRQEILAVHLRKRQRDPAAFDLERLTGLTEGFSGAELEQIVVSGLYTAFANDSELTTEVLEHEAKQTVPLSVTMAESISRLRNWAKARAVFAD